MVKRLIITVLLMSTFPAMASAASWFFNTQAKNAGGIITSRNMVNQTSIKGSLFKSYTTHAPLSATVAANTGYSISNVTVNGVVISNPASPYTTTVQGMTTQSVLATFAVNMLSVTASAGAGGTVLTPASMSNIYYGKKLTSAMVFTFMPQTGYRLAGLTGAAGATVSAAVPAGINATVTVTYPIGYVFTTPVALAGTFGSDNPIAIAGAPQMVLKGALVTLTASHAGGSGATPTYVWEQYAGPSVSLLTNGNLASFTASTVGTYSFSVTLDSGSSAITKVVVNDSLVAAVRTLCQDCHFAGLVRTAANVFNKWSSSRHSANLVTCANCHIGADSGGHPGPALTSSSFLSVCNGCHFDGSGTVPGHPVDIGNNVCSTCHDPHSLVATGPGDSVHFNNITTGVYPASYVTSRTVCASCHVSGLTNSTIRKQWKLSGHADNLSAAWMGNDFKTKSGCVQCHSTTGFIAYSTGKATAAWGDAADKTKEVLACVGCHLNVATGALRTVTPIRPYADDAYTNPNLGKSNLCMNCHSGTKNGKSITAQQQALADFTNLPFIGSHNMAAGGTSYGRVGYHFTGRTYNAAAIHATKLGTLNGSGSCVACHKTSESGHKFQAGATALCASCHGASFNAARLSSDKAAFLNALEVLRTQLAANGFTYSPNYPYFSNSNWGAGQAGPDTMGAAFNYVLLVKEPGAYAHNPPYASQLVLDSIDYLDNGQFDDSVSTLAMPGLLGQGAITQPVIDSMTIYKSKNPCLTCHGGTRTTSAPMATNAHDAHITAGYGPGAYLGNVLSSCQSCHSYAEATHMNGSAEVLTGAGSACTGCHPGVKPAWNGARLACTDCHALVASTLPNGVFAPYKADFALKGHGQFAASNQCVACHDANSGHITGTQNDNKRLSLANDNTLCASCHNDSAAVGAGFPAMATHVNMECRICHDVHGTGNPSMIRTSIGATAINFTETTTGLIDTNTNLGLCQVCHGNNTTYYKAGVAETTHYTTGCLNCHKHTSGFLPSGCDSCHGYPPAPVITSTVRGFGTVNNWASARFEDYSGGGGAHLVPAHVSPFAVASEGWTNCTMCHNGGSNGTTPYHVMATPVKSHISNVTVKVDAGYRFDNGFTIYTGAKNLDSPARNVTGSCFNISCHLSASPRWSMER